MTPAKRVWFGLVFAAAFGVAAGLFKGNDAGLRGGIGNLSAPWLLVALFPALHCRSVLRGALLGLASTLVALAGFYGMVAGLLNAARVQRDPGVPGWPELPQRADPRPEP